MAQGASLFRLLNIVTAVLIILGGILLFVHNGSWNSSILGVFIVLFGLLTFALEFAIPETLVYNLGFMFSLLGRGCFYVSMGLLTLAWKWFNIVVGCIIMIIGFFYIAMHFVGATPSPSMSAVPNTSIANLNVGSSEPKSYTNPPGQVDDLQPHMSESQMPQPQMSQSYQSPGAGSYQNPGAYDATHA
ncbi:Late Golgi vesicles protein [Podila minutissima]|uniref:Late Golgi vesicles protein n=1 Tax=Podila minutissima TaxID=64525 RepID=A0A9P5SCE7_9FUNG|nr:Late Golgi vesicles protein [Podila minutissima]